MIKYINGTNLVVNLHRQNEDLDMANSRGLKATSFNNRYYEVNACEIPQFVVGRGNEEIFIDTTNKWKEENAIIRIFKVVKNQAEYEKAEFLTLVESVKALMNEGEQIYYRQAFRWHNADNEPQSNCYEMFPAESIANAKKLKIIRQYGKHIFIGVSV